MKVVGTDLIEGIDLLQCKSGSNMYMTDEKKSQHRCGMYSAVYEAQRFNSFFF